MLLDIFDDDIEPFKLENKDSLIIYNVIPIFRSEMEYKNANDAEALIEKMDDAIIHGPVNIDRTCVIR